IARGAVVTGTAFDQHGDPLPSTRITLMRYVYSPQNGERRLQPSGQSGTTDDRGTYRIYGIPPGEYLVELNAPFSLPGDLRQTTEQSMQAAMQQLRGTRSSSGGPASSVSMSADQAPTVGYAPIFYPGTTPPASATTVKLAKGEERTGVDIPFQLVPTARIEGVVVGPDGLPAPNVSLSVLGAGPSDMSISNLLSTMFGTSRSGANGSFSLTGIAPGQYTVAARTGGGGRQGGSGSAPGLWATAEVTIDGRDGTGVRLGLEPGMTVVGRLQFDGTRPPPQDLSTAPIT